MKKIAKIAMTLLSTMMIASCGVKETTTRLEAEEAVISMGDDYEPDPNNPFASFMEIKTEEWEDEEGNTLSCVGFFATEGSYVSFKFDSKVAAKVALTIACSPAGADQQYVMTDDGFSVEFHGMLDTDFDESYTLSVNNTAITTGFTVEGDATLTEANYHLHRELKLDVDLVKGENEIRITKNESGNQINLDYIELAGKTEITWTPTDNSAE